MDLIPEDPGTVGTLVYSEYLRRYFYHRIFQ